MMLELFDRNREKIAILENAIEITETKKINAIDALVFSLPDIDPKNSLCKPFNLIRYNNGSLYRIMHISHDSNELGTITYECEHVIAILIDTVMFGEATQGGEGVFTREVIEYVLSRQHTQDWILDDCDLNRQFEYFWEEENILSALFSIANRFTDKYIWKFNTQNYPYKVSLKLINETQNPQHYIRKGHNRLTLTRQSDPRQLCTKLKPIGSGEGINKLDISSVNDDSLFLYSPVDIIEKYGIIERAWIDRRYTDAQSLKEAGQSMLAELQEPIIEYETQFIGDCNIGDIVQIVGDIKTYITEIQIRHSEIPEQTIKIANTPKDIANTVADLADRQRIEMTYSQGATQIYAYNGEGNADNLQSYELDFYIPETMININEIQCKIKLSQMRSEFESTLGGGGNVLTTQNGGFPTTGATSGGSQTVGLSIDVEYGDNPTSYYEGEPRHNHYNKQVIHHKHNVGVPDPHTHTTPLHSHAIAAADLLHTHGMTPKINFHGNPQSFWIYINGVKTKFFNSVDSELDISQMLVEDRTIPRGKWHTIGILPNDKAHVKIALSVQGFIQSRGDKTL